MMGGALLQFMGGLFTWSATRIEMDQIMIHGKVILNTNDSECQDEVIENRNNEDNNTLGKFNSIQRIASYNINTESMKR